MNIIDHIRQSVGVNRTGSELVFNNISAFYNADTPSDSSTITLNEDNPIKGMFCIFYNDGTVEPSINALSTYDYILNGTWASGKLHSYIFYFDGYKFVGRIDILDDYTPPLPMPTILFSDVFTGTTIDTAKWDVTNPNSANITFVQNGNLTVSSDGTGSISSGANYMTSDSTWDLSTTKAFSFDIQSNNQDCYGGWIIALSNGVDNYIVFYNGTANSGTNIRLLAAEGGVSFINTADINLPLSTTKTIKILVTPTTTSISYWNGSAWVSITSAAHTWSASDLKIRIANGNNSNDTAPNLNTNVFDNVYIVDGDFSTQYPI